MSRVLKALEGKAKSFYNYGVTFASTAPGVSSVQTIQVDQDADFYWIKSSFSAALTGAAQTDSTRVVPLMTVIIQDGKSARPFMNEAISIPSIFGTGEIPYILPVVHRIVAGTTLTVTVYNVSGATTYTDVRLTFSGFKVYRA